MGHRWRYGKHRKRQGCSTVRRTKCQLGLPTGGTGFLSKKEEREIKDAYKVLF